MAVVLALIFLVIPILELAVIIQVGESLGALNTVGLLILISLAGAWLVKREGLGVWRRFNAQVRAGGVPTREIADGVLIIFAGALLLTPGFLTDVLGLLLLLPPVRGALRGAAMLRASRRVMRVRRG
ncbi:MAG: FxsA family protein [Actinomycetota bacterium]|nr:FxsA family protein [Actinomycetota bacterium]